jgi:Uncharacterized protein conserved in bacteria (DUF2188)
MSDKKNDVHVVPHLGRWATRREGAGRVSQTYETQGAAIAGGRETARRERVELVIHRPTGQIRDSDSYGSDPHPPKDKKH